MLKRLFATEKGVTKENGRFASPNSPLIDLRNVTKAYETPAGDFLALKEINLTVNNGEFVAVIGKSGSGKTTLVNMITGIDRPTAGEVVIGGRPIQSLSEGAMAEWRGRNVGVVFQFFQLLPMLTNIENVMLPMDFAGTFGGQRTWRERALGLLDEVDIAEHAFKLPSEISGGQQQRVAIARALANDPPIIVADEPTGNLDQNTAQHVFELFERLVAAGKTIFMVTHDKDLARRVNRTIILSDGVIIDEYMTKTFPTLDAAQMAAVQAAGEPQTYAPEAVILAEGEQPGKAHVIVDGEVEILLREPNGQHIVAVRLKPGQYFEEISMLRGGERSASIVAHPATAVSLVTLAKDKLHQIIDG